jgi:hypothetical protein
MTHEVNTRRIGRKRPVLSCEKTDAAAVATLSATIPDMRTFRVSPAAEPASAVPPVISARCGLVAIV